MPSSTLAKDVPIIKVPDGGVLAHAIVDTVRDPLLVLDENLRIAAASRAFHQTFQLADEDVYGLLIYEIGNGQWNIPELRTILEKIAVDQITVENYEVSRVFPRVGQRIMLLNARKVFYAEGTHTTTLLAFEDITERRAIEQQVQELLREKDLLMEEMQHRVSNSLQIIASILLMKARTVQSEETRLQLHDAHRRVMSIAAVQRHLHDAGRGGLIEIDNYLSKLCQTLAQSMIGDSRTISLKVDADVGMVISHQAVSIGLIVTELVMNALKHAFPNEKNNAAIVISYKAAEADWKLTISDNGVGKQELSASEKKGGLGTSLVQALAKQLGGRVDTESNSHGTVVTITHATFKSKPRVEAA